jgi:hypothetical protein
LYIAVPGLRRAGDDAKGDQLALLCRWQRDPYGLLEGRNVADDMVRGQDQQDGVRIGTSAANLQGREGRERYRRRGITSERLQDECARLDIDLPQLLRHQEPVRLIANDDGGRRRHSLEAQRRLLQHGALAGQGEQLLGI